MKTIALTFAAALLAGTVAACSGGAGEGDRGDSPSPAIEVGTDAGTTTTSSETDDGGTRKDAAADVARPPPAPLPIPKLVGSAETCKLISNTKLEDPAANKAQFRANVTGTDLGIPVEHDGTLYFLFGDTVGFRGIWGFGESPDAVGFSLASPAAVAVDPSVLCTNLRFLTLPVQSSVGPSQDSRIERDFAGVHMTPPAGHAIGEYVHNPANTGFPNLPGDFEVPSGAFSYGGSMYVFYTTVDGAVQMKGSYLAKWVAPSPSALPAYDILYGIDQRFTANGPLNGDFINIAPLVHGSYVYLYGTGDYRQSAVHLARKALATLGQPGGFERYDATTKSWLAPGTPVAPIVPSLANGEMSIRYFPAIGRYMMLNQEQGPAGVRVIARFSEKPEGPWSDVVVHDLADPAFKAKYCCTANACLGEQLFHCDRAGFYGTYLLPEVKVQPDGSFVVSYVMSTWDPYNVALMQATFK
jgi:hypothetical protein